MINKLVNALLIKASIIVKINYKELNSKILRIEENKKKNGKSH